jgi:hypothetical protein
LVVVSHSVIPPQRLSGNGKFGGSSIKKRPRSHNSASNNTIITPSSVAIISNSSSTPVRLAIFFLPNGELAPVLDNQTTFRSNLKAQGQYVEDFPFRTKLISQQSFYDEYLTIPSCAISGEFIFAGIRNFGFFLQKGYCQQPKHVEFPEGRFPNPNDFENMASDCNPVHKTKFHLVVYPYKPLISINDDIVEEETRTTTAATAMNGLLLLLC